MIPKHAKLYQNGVKIAIFLGKITNIAQNDLMASGGGCLPADPDMSYAKLHQFTQGVAYMTCF